MSELNKIALKIISNGKGILAADESTGTMAKGMIRLTLKALNRLEMLIEICFFLLRVLRTTLVV